MQLYLAFTLFTGCLTYSSIAKPQYGDLPHISDLIDQAYPTWCIDADENRIMDLKTCSDGTVNGRFSPLYLTYQHSGEDPAKGGYPSNIDIHYPFEYAAPYFGQACAGSAHHCSENFDGSTENCKSCPKIITSDDQGQYGPGHVPPHISLAALTWAYEDGKGGKVEDWFQYDVNACRVLPNKLFMLVREYFPREKDGSVYYPPPFSQAGGDYPLEFVNLVGDSCAAEEMKHPNAGELDCFEDHSGDVSLYPDYLHAGHGSPHYCTKEGKEADVNNDWCPYIFFGPNRGKYRHPHIALSALETYLANKVMPSTCGTSWDDSNYPAEVDTTRAFPDMEGGFPEVDGLEAPEQPSIENGKWTWPGPEGAKKKPVLGNFATNLYIEENNNDAPTPSVPPPVLASIVDMPSVPPPVLASIVDTPSVPPPVLASIVDKAVGTLSDYVEENEISLPALDTEGISRIAEQVFSQIENEAGEGVTEEYLEANADKIAQLIATDYLEIEITEGGEHVGLSEENLADLMSSITEITLKLALEDGDY